MGAPDARQERRSTHRVRSTQYRVLSTEYSPLRRFSIRRGGPILGPCPTRSPPSITSPTRKNIRRRPICAVFGDERFLRRLAVNQLRGQVLGETDAEFSLTRFDGEAVHLRDVMDELSTIALFGGGRRLVVIEDADEFVSRHRAELEAYVARPKSSGVLVLDVSAWPKNTRLYKALDAEGLQVDCKTPEARGLIKWLVSWSQKRHGAKLETGAAEVLLEMVGADLGLLDQELAKLAVSVAEGQAITEPLVQELVGGWRAKTAWDMIDAALAGNLRAPWHNSTACCCRVKTPSAFWRRSVSRCDASLRPCDCWNRRKPRSVAPA